MNLKELKNLLEENHVPTDEYSLKGGLPNEAMCITKNTEGMWEVYYSERGRKTGLKTYLNESSACEELIKKLQYSFPIQWP